MAFERTCPNCRTRLEIPDELRDRPVRCSQCGAVISPDGAAEPRGAAAVAPPPTPGPPRQPWEDRPPPGYARDYDRGDDYRGYRRPDVRGYRREDVVSKVYGPGLLMQI